MRGLFFPGAKCNSGIWDAALPLLLPISPEFAAYPHDRLRVARAVSDLADWAERAYDLNAFDYIAGHSMGGQIALELARRNVLHTPKLVLIESSPVPSGAFYRNLMTPAHMERMGGQLRSMMEREAVHYSEQLLAGLRDDFDYCDAVRAYPGDVFALFGDRNRGIDSERLHALNLPADVAAKMRISFIKNACHMPMLENPDAFAAALISFVLPESTPSACKQSPGLIE